MTKLMTAPLALLLQCPTRWGRSALRRPPTNTLSIPLESRLTLVINRGSTVMNRCRRLFSASNSEVQEGLRVWALPPSIRCSALCADLGAFSAKSKNQANNSLRRLLRIFAQRVEPHSVEFEIQHCRTRCVQPAVVHGRTSEHDDVTRTSIDSHNFQTISALTRFRLLDS